MNGANQVPFGMRHAFRFFWHHDGSLNTYLFYVCDDPPMDKSGFSPPRGAWFNSSTPEGWKVWSARAQNLNQEVGVVYRDGRCLLRLRYDAR